MADTLMPTDTTKYNIVHRLRLHEAAIRQEATTTDAGMLDLADTLFRAREEIFLLRAEVERLTQQLDAIRRGNEAVSTCGGAPASLPTPASEGTDGNPPEHWVEASQEVPAATPKGGAK